MKKKIIAAFVIFIIFMTSISVSAESKNYKVETLIEKIL